MATRTRLATITKKRARPRSSTTIQNLAQKLITPPSSHTPESPMTVSLTQALTLHHPLLPTSQPNPKLARKILGKSLDRLTDEEFVGGLVLVLEQMMSYNKDTIIDLPDRSSDISVFYSTLKQPFGLGYYVGRLVNHMGCSRSVFVSALIYLERLKKVDDMLGVCEMNVHRLLVTAAALAAKWLEDEVYCNEYYQRVGGVPSVREFNRLEKVFLEKCQWRLSVGKGEFAQVEESVVAFASDMLSECDSD